MEVLELHVTDNFVSECCLD